MIFITLGSQKFQMNRLLISLDKLKEKKLINDTLYAQTGFSDYKPKNFEYRNFLNKNEFQNKMVNSDLVICHGGTGAIVGALKLGKKVIAVPREKKFNEHVDNHQFEIVNTFVKLNLVMTVGNLDDLAFTIEKIKFAEMENFQSTNKIMIDELRKEIEN